MFYLSLEFTTNKKIVFIKRGYVLRTPVKDTVESNLYGPSSETPLYQTTGGGCESGALYGLVGRLPRGGSSIRPGSRGSISTS